MSKTKPSTTPKKTQPQRAASTRRRGEDELKRMGLV